MQHKRANGQRVGTIPFGFRLAEDESRLEEDADEQDVLSRIRELKTAGRTLRQIADELNRQGYTTRRGTAWRPPVRRIGSRRVGADMRKRTVKPKAPKPDQEWFRQKVAELDRALEKLPADPQEQLQRELEEHKER
jgi:hypothetical protein